MKKKSLLTMCVALGLTAAVGVGGTLAILSQKSNVVTNTFAAGEGIEANKDITLYESTDETKENPEKGVRNTYLDNASVPDGKYIDIDGIEYKDLEPNMTIKKDPSVHIAKDTADCYLFVKVENLATDDGKGFLDVVGKNNVKFDNEQGTIPTNGKWKLLEETEDIYYYADSAAINKGQVIDTSNNAVDTEPLFSNITFLNDAKLYEKDIPQIRVKALAVQATENNSQGKPVGNWEDAVAIAQTAGSWE